MMRIVVTGANKGIGYEIVRCVRGHFATTEHGAEIWMACRNLELGQKALREILSQEMGGAQNKVSLKLVELDLTKPDTIQSAATTVGAPVDVLINNAGMAYKGDAFGREVAAHTIGTNFEGTLLVIEAFLPLMLSPSSSGGSDSSSKNRSPPSNPRGTTTRIINVASRAGLLSPRRYSQDLLRRWTSVKKMDDIFQLTQEFTKAAGDGSYEARGWPRQTYAVSKAAEIAMTQLLANQYRQQGMFFYTCCPGWCRTDMAGSRAPRSAQEGADTPAWLACVPDAALPPTGSFVTERRVQSWLVQE
ncbi:unnamed protein product [Amoebophrya sp. A25]|nr:unnamed protein product [Amoebophrya sp. A25]|eukprot:GSA25T00015923001.1